MRILIADDDSILRLRLEVALKKWGYEVLVARDGEQAWQLLNQTDAPRLAILDWMMPGIDGIEICRRIRKRLGEGYTYLLLLTSRDSKEYTLEGLDAGADDFLIKPFDPEELKVRLRAGIRILRQEEALLEALNDHRRTNDLLEQERNLLRNLIDNIPDQVYVKDSQGRYLESNAAHLRLLGATSRDEVVGRMSADFLPEELPVTAQSIRQEQLRADQPLYDVDEVVIDWMGRTRLLSTTILPLWHADGRLMALVHVSRDLTGKRTAEVVNEPSSESDRTNAKSA